MSGHPYARMAAGAKVMALRGAMALTEGLARLRGDGHLPLRQGDAVDCARCGKTGRFDGVNVVGELATGTCEAQS
jgi:hypothetical protein